MAVHLAAGLGRQRVHEVSSGISGAGRLSPSRSRAAARSMSRPYGGQVADQDLVAGRGGLHCGGRAGDTGQGLQGGVDFAEFDPAAAQLDLFIGAAREEQALGFIPHEVAGAVGAPPAQGRHRGVLLGVLGRVQVAGQPDAADDQFAHPALGDRLRRRASTTARSQPSSGSPIRTGPAPPAARRRRPRWPRWDRRCSTLRGRRRPAARQGPAGTPRRRRSAGARFRAPRPATARPAWGPWRRR